MPRSLASQQSLISPNLWSMTSMDGCPASQGHYGTISIPSDPIFHFPSFLTSAVDQTCFDTQILYKFHLTFLGWTFKSFLPFFPPKIIRYVILCIDSCLLEIIYIYINLTQEAASFCSLTTHWLRRHRPSRSRGRPGARLRSRRCYFTYFFNTFLFNSVFLF